ncbi:hypothetical protein JW899_01875 [Candidatus Uhrbacteria bacterium]|nr:hypothetical protein [Candidatus Uhrbacteria bacterium]
MSFKIESVKNGWQPPAKTKIAVMTAVFMACQVLDIHFTNISLANGFEEVNPLMAWCQKCGGLTFPTVKIFLSGVAVSALAVSSRYVKFAWNSFRAATAAFVLLIGYHIIAVNFLI